MDRRALAERWASHVGIRSLASACLLVCLLAASPSFATTVPSFTKVTADIGLDDEYIALGVYGPGVAVFDFDGDEDLDVFVPNDHSGHKLYQNQGDGTFIDIAPSLGLNFSAELPPVEDRVHPFEDDPTSMMPNFVDTDNDGDLDFFLTNWNAYCRFFENVGGTYVDKTHESGLALVGHCATAAFGDYNLDGDLDILIADWGGRDHLMRNEGNNVWTDVSDREGLWDVPFPEQPSWCALWFDHNGDRWPDLYVGVDYGNPNFFYKNQGNGFTERGAQTFFSPDGGGATMGQAIGDYDLDGDFDMFVANSLINDFYRRDGNVYNDLMSDPESVGPGGPLVNLKNNDIGWHCDFQDFDNDGWEDLFLVNGYIILCLYDDPLNPDCGGMGKRDQPNLLWMNKGDGSFDRVTDEAGLTDYDWGKAGAVADFDRDGDLDVFVTNTGNASYPSSHGFWRNDTTELGNWLIVELEGVDSNIHGYGALVKATVGETTYMRQHAHSRGYLAQASQEIHFGLGDAEVIDELEVIWPKLPTQENPRIDRWTNVPVNQRLMLTESTSGVPARAAPRLVASANSDGIELRWSVDASWDWDDFVVFRSSPGSMGGTRAEIPAHDGQSEYRWVDHEVRAGESFEYRVIARFSEGRVESESYRIDAVSVLSRLFVEAARPNPFNPRTTLRFYLPPASTSVRLRIVDAAGRLVNSLPAPEARGWQQIVWDGTDGRGHGVASGNYRFLVESDGQVASTSLSLVR